MPRLRSHLYQTAVSVGTTDVLPGAPSVAPQVWSAVALIALLIVAFGVLLWGYRRARRGAAGTVPRPGSKPPISRPKLPDGDTQW